MCVVALIAPALTNLESHEATARAVALVSSYDGIKICMSSLRTDRARRLSLPSSYPTLSPGTLGTTCYLLRCCRSATSGLFSR